MIKNWRILQKTPESRRQRIILVTMIGFLINVAYGVANGVFGAVTHSWWFLTMSAYYIILSVMRYAVVSYELKHRGAHSQNEIKIKRFAGSMLLVLSWVMIGTVVLTVATDRGTKYHEIVMITIALYTFTKITLAIIKLCKCGKDNSPLIMTIRNISLADAVVSMFALQRSMLMTFEGMSISDIRLMNILTGIGVCLVLIVLGVNLLRPSKKQK